MKFSKLKHIFSIEKEKNRIKLYILGIKIKFKILKPSDYIRKIIREEISYACAREISTALTVHSLHSKIFPQFKNINNEASVAIIGCGPSVKYYNNEIDAKNIALNDAIFFENIKYDTLFVWDSNILKTTPGYLERIYKLDCKKFIGHFINPERGGSFGQLTYPQDSNIYECYSSNRITNCRKGTFCYA